MKVSYTFELPMGHRLQNHPGKCKNLHGHNYTITTSVIGLVDEDTGMVIDFHDLKTAVREVLGGYDHAFILQEGDTIFQLIDPHERQNIIYLPYPPTAEVLAFHWQKLLQNHPRLHHFAVSVKVAETKDCEAYT